MATEKNPEAKKVNEARGNMATEKNPQANQESEKVNEARVNMETEKNPEANQESEKVNEARVNMATEKNPRANQDSEMVKKARVTMATEKNLQAAEILTGHHQLRSAFPKDYSICQSSAKDYSSSEPEEIYDDSSPSDIDSDKDGASSVENVSSSSSEGSKDAEGNDDSSEDDEADHPTATKIYFPRRYRAHKILSEDFRKLLEKKVMQPISQEDAEKCLGKKRFKLVLETNPIPQSFVIVDSRGFLMLVWSTLGPGDEWLLDEETRVRLKLVAGAVRFQRNHFICWAYVDCDLISAARVLNGLDKDFVPLSPMFLCRNVVPEKYKKKREAEENHCCFGLNPILGLIYAELYGVPKERPEEVKFDCKISEDFIAGQEELYKVKDIFRYDTLDSALRRLKSGYPVGATLMLFNGWDKYHVAENDDDMIIYEGPKPGKKYEEDHAVIMIDFRKIRGKKVVICKLSNGAGVGNGGYLAVSVDIMISWVGARKKYAPYVCDNKPQYLLRDFFSVDVQMGVDPLVTVDPIEVEENKKFKLDINTLDLNLPLPSCRSPAPADTDSNQKELIDACGVVQSVSSTMGITRKNDHEMIPQKDITKFQLCSNLPTSDNLFRLQTILLTDPQGAVNFALMMSKTEGGCPVNFNTITDLFLQRNLIREATAFLLNVLKPNLPEHAFLQTKVLEINLVAFPKVADAILANGMFSHYDWPRVAQLCEKAGLYIQALKHYSELLDIKRVIVNSHAIEPQALVEFLGTLSIDWAIKCMKDLLLVNLRGDLQIVQACKEYCEQLGVDACTKLFEQFKSYEGLYFLLGSYLSMSEDPEIHFKYIEAAAKTGQIKEVERVTRESHFYDAEKAKTCLMEAKLPEPRPLINVCDRFGFVPDLTHYLYPNNMHRYIGGYVQKVNPGNTPLVVGQLLDDECHEDLIESAFSLFVHCCMLNPLLKNARREIDSVSSLSSWRI